jgi:hypothetical protein
MSCEIGESKCLGTQGPVAQGGTRTPQGAHATLVLSWIVSSTLRLHCGTRYQIYICDYRVRRMRTESDRCSLSAHVHCEARVGQDDFEGQDHRFKSIKQRIKHHVTLRDVW